MKILIGLFLFAVGAIIFIAGDRQIGKYGIISKWFFDPPHLTDKYKGFSKKLQKWAFGGLLIYFGLMFILGRY